MALIILVQSTIEKDFFSKPTIPLSNKNILKEIKKRTDEMQTGSIQTYTWEEVQQKAELSLQKARASQK